MLCGLVIDGVLDVANELAWSPGKDYTIISFSVDPSEDHTLAAEYKADTLANWINLTHKMDGIFLVEKNLKLKKWSMLLDLK